MPTNATPRAEPAISRDPTPNGSAASDSTATPAASAPTETAGNAAHSRAATYDVFVSHSSKDKSQADTLCVALEGAGLRCWIAPRNIDPGRKWDESIMDGIASSRVVLLVHSANANASDDVEREIVHASNAELPVLPVRLEDVQLSKSMSYHLVQAQWLDAFPPPIDAHLAMVVEAVQELVRRPPGSTAAFATPDTGAATSGRGTRPPLLRDLVALPALVALDVVVGVWVALNARGAIEWVTANAAIGGLIALLWKMLPAQTTERARYDFARALGSRKVAASLTAVSVVFLVATAFVSTVRVSADLRGRDPGSPRMLPATIHIHEPAPDSVARSAEAEPNTLVIDSLRLAGVQDEVSTFVPIAPLGRRVFLEASPQYRTRDFRLVPWLPLRVVYPADFETPTLSVLPLGTLVNDIFALPQVVVYRQRASDSVMIGQATLRSMGAMQFSIASPPAPDSATRIRWVRAVQIRVDSIDAATANEAVAAWMEARWVRTREPLAVGDRLRVVVISGGQTLSSDTLTLTASATDVILTRRP